jgi:transposase InsO family protein
VELRSVIVEEVEQTKRRSGLRVREILAALGVGRSAYYNWRSAEQEHTRGQCGVQRTNCYSLLPGEREKIIRYALRHPDVRHRELAWKMVDEDVVCVSPSTVYRVLKEEDLVATRVKRKKRYHQPSGWGSAPDERWQSDLRYVKIQGKDYYLIMFLDEYSRYVVHWELLPSMDGNSLALAAAEALSKLDAGRRPDIQTDNGSGYISREFKMVLSDHGIGHHRIRPHTPEDNSLVERVHRTVGEALDAFEVETYWEARERIAEIVEWYNQRRLHSGINFLRPIDYYRGDPQRLLRIRQRKIEQARHHRKEENLKRKQRTLFFSFPQEPEPLISATCEKSSFL